MRFTLSILSLLLFVEALGAANWPQWRGPSLNGVSEEKGLPVHWGPTDNVSWKLPMPARSGSTPIIWKDKIFLNAADKDELLLWCVDRNEGRVLWKRHLSGGNRNFRKHNMSSPSPVTDGKRVWVMTGNGVLKSFDFSGKEIWTRNIQNQYGVFGHNHGYGSSPLLYEGTLYILVLHGMKTDDPSYVLAVDTNDGQTLWRIERPTDAILESPDSYTTPALWRYGDTVELVVSGGDYVTGHDLTSGKELWRAGGLNPERNRFYRTIASPVTEDEMVYVPTRVKPLLAFKVGGRGDITDSHRVWATENGPDVPTPVTDGKYFYILNDKGIMWCLDAKTGQEIWARQRVEPGTYSASPVLADGKIYVLSEDGVTTVVKAGPQFMILGKNDLQGYTLSSPAISDGQIFIRTEDFLYCIGEKTQASQ